MNQVSKPKSPDLKCPICAASVTKDMEHFPFCSKRCKLVDLGRWLGGDYQLSRPISTQDEEQFD